MSRWSPPHGTSAPFGAVPAVRPTRPGAHAFRGSTASATRDAVRLAQRARDPLRLRIVYVWDADYPWDVRTEKICSTLRRGGHDVHIVARNKGRAVPNEVLREGHVHRLRPWAWVGQGVDDLLSFPAFFNPRWISRLHAVAKEVAADVIVVRDLPLCPTAIFVGRLLGIPVVLDMAENYPAMIREIWEAGRQRPWDVIVRNPRLVAAVERGCLPRLDAVLVVVEESAERLRRELCVPDSRIAVVSNTPPRERTERWSPLRPQREFVELVYLGLLELPRGVAELLMAGALCLRQRMPVRLTIVGDGRDAAILRARAAALGLGSRVRFTGHLEHRDALDIVAAADIGVVPHHADEAWNTTIPNKLFDYMAAGLPVVSSDAEPSARVLRMTGAGLTFRSGDAGSLRDAIRSLLDPEVRAAMGAAGRAAIRDRFNWEHDTAVLLRVVTRLAS
jgi:glycosyltransferase involved in cell wall biosynthesis